MKIISVILFSTLFSANAFATSSSNTNISCNNRIGGTKQRITVRLKRGVLEAKVYSEPGALVEILEVSRDLSGDSQSVIFSSHDFSLSVRTTNLRGQFVAHLRGERWLFPVNCTGKL